MYKYQATGVNNPFSNDPADARNRFPDVSATSPAPSLSPQYTSWMPQQQQQQQTPQQFYQQPNLTQPQQQFNPGGYGMNAFAPGTGGGLMIQPTGFQPTSNFGQQLASQGMGSSYGYLQGQQQPQSPQSYNPAQQQLSSAGYASVASLDPYSSLDQGWDGSPQQQQQIQSPTVSTPTGMGSSFQTTSASKSANGDVHPREYIRTHKAQIESWDSYAWKQLVNAYEALKDAWQSRKTVLEGNVNQTQMQVQYSGGGYYAAQLQQEVGRLQGLVKEAESNFDSVAASTFQMQEVFQNYRQSGDMASKSRVREAVNAALQGLPDWPSQLF